MADINPPWRFPPIMNPINVNWSSHGHGHHPGRRPFTAVNSFGFNVQNQSSQPRGLAVYGLPTDWSAPLTGTFSGPGSPAGNEEFTFDWLGGAGFTFTFLQALTFDSIVTATLNGYVATLHWDWSGIEFTQTGSGDRWVISNPASVSYSTNLGGQSDVSPSQVLSGGATLEIVATFNPA